MTLPLEGAGRETAELFERTFNPDGRNGGRPKPEDWIRALEALKGALCVCVSVPWHQYAPELPTCPWCALERASGVKLFGGLARPASAPVVDLATLWARYLRIADPGPPRPLPREEDWVPPPATCEAEIPPHPATRPTGRWICVPGACALCGDHRCQGGNAPCPHWRPPSSSSRTWDRTAQSCRPLMFSMPSSAPIRPGKRSRTNGKRNRRPPDFSSHRQAIEALKAKLDALGPEREARIRALARVISEAEQRADYLGQFRIETAGLYNIGAARCAVLRSWGIETAAEVNEGKIAEIPGFGRNLTDRLVNWRERT